MNLCFLVKTMKWDNNRLEVNIEEHEIYARVTLFLLSMYVNIFKGY